MPKKKGNGEGMTRKRANGKWESRFSFIDGYGAMHSKSFYGKTKAEVFEKMQTAQRLLKENNFDYERTEPVTVTEWIEFYLLMFKKGKVGFNTLDSYANIYLTHIKKPIGKKFLGSVTPLDVQKIINDIDCTVSTRTAELVMVVLKDSFKFAIQYGYTENNPTLYTVMPVKKQKNSRAMDLAERKTFRSNLHILPFDEQCLLLTYFTTGARSSEVLALEWKNVLFERGFINIAQNYKRAQVGFEIGTTKTKKEGLVPLDPQLKTMLLKLKETSNSKYVFPSLTNPNKPLDIYKPLKVLNNYTSKVGINDLTIIDLRHTFATICMENGVRKTTVKNWLRHSGNSKMLDTVYEHLNDDFNREQAKLLHNAF